MPTGNPVRISIEREPAIIRDCVAMRRRIFLETYGPLGLRDWPGEADRFDLDGSSFFVARQGEVMVGHCVLHVEAYDGTQAFWMDRLGVPLRDLVPDGIGLRIGELGRLAVDKARTTRPLDVASALGRAVMNAIARQRVDVIIATAFSETMLAFYEDLVRRTGGTLDVHPRMGHYAGIDMIYMVVRPEGLDFV